MDLKQGLEVVSRTGKYIPGFRRSMEACFAKRATLLIVSGKAAEWIKVAARSVSAVSGVRLLEAPLSPSEIGVALKKNFPVATLAIIDPGSADFGLKDGEESIE